ncbi:hypothetical protein GCM10010294_51440 [Streptomyces griseoloalbus]|nr:hypothetical protein GCM10010294_51440 [Streptomyces griseoloalbus]
MSRATSAGLLRTNVRVTDEPQSLDKQRHDRDRPHGARDGRRRDLRRRRLERTRTDLADPRLRHRTIGEIATRWGFRHPADFCRTFRRACGVFPKDFRSGVERPRSTAERPLKLPGDAPDP